MVCAPGAELKGLLGELQPRAAAMLRSSMEDATLQEEAAFVRVVLAAMAAAGPDSCRCCLEGAVAPNLMLWPLQLPAEPHGRSPLVHVAWHAPSAMLLLFMDWLDQRDCTRKRLEAHCLRPVMLSTMRVETNSAASSIPRVQPQPPRRSTRQRKRRASRG